MKSILARMIAVCMLFGALAFAQGTAPAAGKKTDDTKKTDGDKGKGKGKGKTKATAKTTMKTTTKTKGKAKAKGGDKDKGKGKTDDAKKGGDDKGGKK